MNDKLTKQPWQLVPFADTYQTPEPLYEVRVKDWSTGLAGDYRGCIVAYVPGGYADDTDTAAVAQANAELIASAPTLKEEVERLTAENARLSAQIAKMTDDARESARIRNGLSNGLYAEVQEASLLRQQSAALAALLVVVMQSTGCRMASDPGAAVEFYDHDTLKLQYLNGVTTPIKVVTVTSFDEPAPPAQWGYYMRDWGIGADPTPVLMGEWDERDDALTDMRSRMGEYRASGRHVEEVPAGDVVEYILHSDRFPSTLHYVAPIQRS